MEKYILETKEKMAFVLIELLKEYEWNEIDKELIISKLEFKLKNNLEWLASDKIELLGIFLKSIDLQILFEAEKDFRDDLEASVNEKLTDLIIRKCEIHLDTKLSLIRLRKSLIADPLIFPQLIYSFSYLTKQSLILCGDNLLGIKGNLRLIGVLGIFLSIFEKWLNLEDEDINLIMKYADTQLKKAEELGSNLQLI